VVIVNQVVALDEQVELAHHVQVDRVKVVFVGVLLDDFRVVVQVHVRVNVRNVKSLSREELLLLLSRFALRFAFAGKQFDLQVLTLLCFALSLQLEVLLVLLDAVEPLQEASIVRVNGRLLERLARTACELEARRIFSLFRKVVHIELLEVHGRFNLVHLKVTV